MKVLIAEDDSLIAGMYATKLKNLGIETSIVAEGEAAVEFFEKENPDFVLLDIMLPKLSGLDALKKIRSLPGGESVPVVILSNLSDPEKRNAAQKMGVKEYLVKANLTPNQVVEKIKPHLKDVDNNSLP